MAQLIHKQLQKYVNSLTEPSDGRMKFGKVKEKISDEKVDDVENNNNYCRKDSRANLIVTGLEACRPDTFLNPRLG